MNEPTQVAAVLLGACAVGGLVLCLHRLAQAVETGIGIGHTAELKRAISAMRGEMDDALNRLDRRDKRDDMAARRARKDPVLPLGGPLDSKAERMRALRLRLATRSMEDRHGV